MLEATGRYLAAKAMIQLDNTLPYANAYQSCLIASIMIDKSRLLAGESTANVEVHIKAVGELDDLCSKLSNVLLSRTSDKE